MKKYLVNKTSAAELRDKPMTKVLIKTTLVMIVPISWWVINTPHI